MAALIELEHEYEIAKADAAFQAELALLLKDFAGRPTPLYFAKRLTEELGGAKIYLKREDLLHTGAHKINNALGQALLAKRMGKKRIIAETGAGQHGVATATVCALLGLECVVYMGDVDMERQDLNVLRMRLLGAEVRGVSSGSKTLKDAISEAMRDWVTNVRTTYYLLGSALGAHPYPTMVRDFHRCIGREMKEQILEKEGRLPTAIIACVGGGSNAIGAFYEFIPDQHVRLIGVEAGGRGTALGEHAARFQGGEPGVLQGTYSYVLQDENGQIALTHSVSAGLDYASIGPEHAMLHDIGRAEYVSQDDQAEALDAVVKLARTEGILPALESSHAVAEALRIAPGMSSRDILVINLSGRGDKDMGILARELKLKIDSEGGAPILRTHDPAMAIRFNHKPGLAVYLTAGDPSLEATRAIALEAIDAGADVIELGVPFSDPLADGPIIQRASERSLARGTSLKDVIAVAKQIRAARSQAGLIIFTYSQSRAALRPEEIRRRCQSRRRRRRADNRCDRRRSRGLPRRNGSCAPRAHLSCRAHQSRRAPQGHCYALKGFCLRHLPHRHHRHAAKPRRRCSRPGRPHQAMDYAAGCRGFRHQQR